MREKSPFDFANSLMLKMLGSGCDDEGMEAAEAMDLFVSLEQCHKIFGCSFLSGNTNPQNEK